MDLNTLRGLGTLFALIAFCGVCWWAYGAGRKKDFDEAAQLPFADEGGINTSADINTDNRTDKTGDTNENP